MYYKYYEIYKFFYRAFKAFILINLFFVTNVFSEQVNNIKVVDGDTIYIGDVKHRFHGIDAPEYGQKCNSKNGGLWDCGKEATNKLKELINNQKVICDKKGTDKYDRTLSICKANMIELNRVLVRMGYAWAYRKFSEDYIEEEEKAKSEKIGIWQAHTKTAEEYRIEKSNTAEQQAPNDCVIKGNISKNGKKIYHTPWSPWYNKTRINVNKGEKWFCSEADAIKDGWQPPIWGE